MWLEIQLAMMRYYRENELHKEWKRLNSLLAKLIENFQAETRSRYYYERCLFSLFSLDVVGLKKDVKLWPINNYLPYWEVKRAGLLAEIGDIFKAEKILENTLKNFQDQQNIDTIENDYTNFSQEAYFMLLFKNIRFAANTKRRSYSFDDNIIKGFKNRWNSLIQYKCDPFQELHLFEIKLDKEPIELKEVEEKAGFDIDYNVTYYLNCEDKDVQEALTYLRFVEEIGLPLHLPRITIQDATKRAIMHVARDSRPLAFITLLRAGDEKLIDSVINRRSIFNMDIEAVDAEIMKYINVLKKAKTEIKNGDSFRNETFAINLSKIIPEILSRLCIKSSHTTKLKLLNFLKEIYISEYRDRYRGIKKLAQRLISSFSKSEQYSIISDLLEFPILSSADRLAEEEFVDPFEFIRLDKADALKKSRILIPAETIDDLMNVAKKEGIERGKALKRLIVLWKLDILSESISNRLAEILWSKTNETNGFPVGLNYYYFSYINLPHPLTAKPQELLKAYFSNSVFPIQSKEDNNRGVSFIGRYIQEFQEIIGTGRSSVNFTWDERELNQLVEKTILWWDADKQYLKRKDSSHLFGSIFSEFKARFRNLIDLYTDIFSPNYQLLSHTNQIELHRVLGEFDVYGISENEAYASFYNHLPQYQERTYLKINEGLFSKSKDKIIDSLRGIIKLIELRTDVANNLLLLTSEQIRNRVDIEFDAFLEVIILVVRTHSVLLSDEVLMNVRFGLERLISETEITKSDTLEVISSKISIKVKIAKLTVALYKYYRAENQDIPESIDQWRIRCLGKNEFSEIRKIWVDEVN